MSFQKLMADVMTEKKIGQEELARYCGVSQQAISKYKNQQLPVPDDIALKISEYLQSPRLLAEYMFERKAGFFNVPVLKKVDDHHMVVCYRLLKEFAEAIDATHKVIDLIENKKDKDMTGSIQEQIYDQELQIADTLACVQMHFITMQEKFQFFDTKKLERMQNVRLKNKGYY